MTENGSGDEMGLASDGDGWGAVVAAGYPETSCGWQTASRKRESNRLGEFFVSSSYTFAFHQRGATNCFDGRI
jgi:hypothetical protein